MKYPITQKELFYTRLVPLAASSVVALWMACLAGFAPIVGRTDSKVIDVLLTWALLLCPLIQFFIAYRELKCMEHITPIGQSFLWIICVNGSAIPFGFITGFVMASFVL